MADIAAHPTPQLGTDETAELQRLTAALDELAPALVAGARRSDIDGRLADESVAALRGHGLWQMSLCRELGGLELSMVSQIRVLSRLAAIDTASAWCTMVANHAVALLGATMPAATVERVFAGGVPVCSGVAAPGGTVVRNGHGFVLNGTWRLATSIDHADWIYATAYMDGDPSRLLPMALPAHDVEVIDSWNVVGLSGTGSKDFTVRDYVLDGTLMGRESDPLRQVRGRRRYAMHGADYLESYEHAAFALGVGRRALQELSGALADPAPGRHVADREVVQSELGRITLELHAVETTACELYGRVDRAALDGGTALRGAERKLPRALASWATELALECVQLAFRRSGAEVLKRSNISEKLLRDMSVAATHFVVNDTAFAAYGDQLIETAGAAPPTAGAPTGACG